mgnify:CR=1 FL=1
MGPEEAARTLDLLKPRVAIPMHYGTFPPLTGDPEVFRALGERFLQLPLSDVAQVAVTELERAAA